MHLTSLDHLVLTVHDLTATCDFYTRVLGMQEITFNNRKALKVGNQKINLHLRGHEVKPNARTATPGSADLCFLTDLSLPEIQKHLEACNIPIELGPVPRTGAQGPILSLYLRDPDGNLLELSMPLHA